MSVASLKDLLNWWDEAPRMDRLQFYDKMKQVLNFYLDDRRNLTEEQKIST